ncbi:MAG: carboxypeptidase-like regulatory domain-containing protein, partial [Candidatus Omnitrophica bacterium]|nr:carboxypeptidase-like regulatory domain-containing protein [Candidatus Omnitrophota bacterium]
MELPRIAKFTFLVDAFTQLTPEPPITPTSGFIHGEVLDASTNLPLIDATITLRDVTGEVKSDTQGLYQIPTPDTGTFIVNITKAGYNSIQRKIEVLATRDVAVGVPFLTALDSQVTLITQATGGTATDSSGNFQVEFPPGSAPQDLNVTITPLMDERQLPSPIPQGRAHIQAVYFEPRFTNFLTPATFRARNTFNFPPNTPINLELWDETTQRWIDQPAGSITPDGIWIEFSIIRFFCTYCIYLTQKLPAQASSPNRNQAKMTEPSSQDPDKSCTVEGNSSICPDSGELSEEHTLPSLRSLGQSRNLTFTYRSSTVEPSALIGTNYAINDPLLLGDPPTLTPQTTSAIIQIEGKQIQATFTGSSTGARQAFFWDGTNARDQKLTTGAYPYTITLSNEYPATFGSTGIPTPMPVSLKTTFKGYSIIQNNESSVFGSGWNLNGLQRLYPQP